MQHGGRPEGRVNVVSAKHYKPDRPMSPSGLNFRFTGSAASGDALVAVVPHSAEFILGPYEAWISPFFGEPLVESCVAQRGTSAVCIREAQLTLAQSSKRLVGTKIASLGLGILPSRPPHMADAP
jgi:hypothetical protein